MISGAITTRQWHFRAIHDYLRLRPLSHCQPMLLSGSDWFTANSASSSRVDTPSLSKILLRWCLTVSSLILKYSAISLLEYPATTAATISNSRGVKPNFFCRASSLEDCTSVRKYCTRLETLSRPTQYSPDITV